MKYKTLQTPNIFAAVYLTLGLSFVGIGNAYADDTLPPPASALGVSSPPPLIYFPSAVVDTIGRFATQSVKQAPVPIHFSVSPALPPGLSLDSATGLISGIPTVVSSPNTYTVTAKGPGGPAVAHISIGVTSLVPSGFAYASNPLILTPAVAMKADTAIITGSVTSFTVSPGLPTGLQLDSLTGVISGTPSVDTLAGYTVTASNAWGSTSLVLSIMIPGPPQITSAPSSQTVVSHNSTTFRVQAQGTPNLLAYQWIRNNTDVLKDGTGIQGTATNTLVLTNPGMQDNGTTYQCMVQNAIGSVVSAAATLTIKGAITSVYGSFTVHQSGSTPFSFTLPEGSKGAQLTVTNVEGHVMLNKEYRAQNNSNIVVWDGNDESGHRVVPAMYVIRLKPLDNN